MDGWEINAKLSELVQGQERPDSAFLQRVMSSDPGKAPQLALQLVTTDGEPEPVKEIEKVRVSSESGQTNKR